MSLKHVIRFLNDDLPIFWREVSMMEDLPVLSLKYRFCRSDSDIGGPLGQAAVVLWPV